MLLAQVLLYSVNLHMGCLGLVQKPFEAAPQYAVQPGTINSTHAYPCFLADSPMLPCTVERSMYISMYTHMFSLGGMGTVT